MLSVKTLGILIAGVFVGAVAVEILSKTKPELMKTIREKANKAVDATEKSLTAIKNAFVEGFTETAKPKTVS